MTESVIPRAMPADLTYYNRTPVFTRKNVPAALLAAHSVKAGVYGLIRVLSGRLFYRLEDESNACVTACAGEDIVVEPEIRHRVELLDPDTAFRVEFYRSSGIPVPMDVHHESRT